MLEKYDTANKEGKFGQGYKQNLLLHFILIDCVISGRILLGVCFNHELCLKTRSFREEESISILGNGTGCYTRGMCSFWKTGVGVG